MREYGDRPRPRPHSEAGALSRRLDELSREELDRVLERAIHLHTERRDRTTFTRGQVAQVAAELGLSPEMVERALNDELSVGQIEVSHDRWFPRGPRRVRGRATVRGAIHEVSERVDAWMESEEGLKPTSRAAGGIRWVKDTHWATGARLAMGTDSTKAIRGMRQTVHRIRPASPERHVVEVEVDTERIRTVSGWVGAGVASAGILGGVGTATAVTGGFDVGQFAAVAIPGVVVGSATALVIARTWTRAIRDGVRRALDGISHPDLYERAARRMARRRRSQRTTLERLVDDVSDAIDRLLR